MAVNKINDDILSREIIQGRIPPATSGKKEETQEAAEAHKKTDLHDVAIFSDDARRLQETEVILQNALQKLNEMDEIQHANLAEFKEKIDHGFYNQDDILEKVVDEMFSEDELRSIINKRMTDEQYVAELKKMDAEYAQDEAKLEKIRDRIQSGYYNSPEVAEKIADELIDLIGF